MKQFSFFLMLSLVLVASCKPKDELTSNSTVLQGATLFDGNGKVIANSRVIIRDGRIVAVGAEEVTIPKNAEIIDLTGKFITPGLVDAHVHFSQTGFFDGRPDALDLRDSIPYDSLQAYLKKNPDRYYESYLRAGVTAVYDVGGYDWTIDLQRSAEENLDAPHVAAAGPLLTHFPQERLSILNQSREKQMLSLDSPEFGTEYVKRNADLGSTGIKIWMINLKDSLFMQSLRTVAAEVPGKGNQLIVHATDLDQAKEAIRLGAKVLVHSVDDQRVDDEFLQLAKRSEVIYCPTLLVVRGYYVASKSLQGKFPLEDPNGIVDAETKHLVGSSKSLFRFYPDPDEYAENLKSEEELTLRLEETMFSNLKRVYEAGITIALSTDAGNPGTLHGLSVYDELEAMQRAGIPAIDIIPMSTRNGARAMRRLEDFGTLENGKIADLIILEKDPSLDVANFRSITQVMRGGMLRPVNVPFDK